MTDIDVSTGGRTSVATDELVACAMVLDGIAGDALLRRFDLAAAEMGLVVLPDAAPFAFAAGDIADAVASLERAGAQAAEVASALTVAAGAYDLAESAATMVADVGAAFAAQMAGSLVLRSLPALVAPAVLAALPFAAPALVSAGVLWANPVTRRVIARFGTEAGEWIWANARVLSTPAVVGLVRAAVSASDDLVAGATGAPRFLTGSGTRGVVSSPLAAGVSRWIDTPVSIRQTAPAVQAVPAVQNTPTVPAPPAVTAGPGAESAPRSIADVSRRIPSGQGPTRVRIEKYTTEDGRSSWAVYIAGTAEMLPGGGPEAFDIESAVASVAGEDAAAYRAVDAAMSEAGIAPGDPVMLAGHSQGGLIASAVAGSGDYSVDTVVSFGSPGAHVPTLDEVTTIAVEHTDDLVPALAGQPPVGDDRVVVTRDSHARETVPGAFGAHGLSEYTETAELMDASLDPRLVELRATLDSITEGKHAGTFEYQARRE